ncbi:MAG: hypothetical protein QOG15_3539 [Solirubrobacteraceae bacterium]|nr:hypothetical protein [Solirubrobacteraceae bacterium]
MAAVAAEVRPIGHDTDDRDLVEGVRAGDDRAFEALYGRYQPRIMLYIRGMVQDDGRAEDITQEVFMSALRRMRETDSEIAFKRWIYEIAKNACIDAFRRSRHTDEVSFDVYDAIGADEHGRLADSRATPDIAVDTKLQLDSLRGAFGVLSDTHHQIIVMRELEGLSYRDIGERLGMTRPAVESTLFRARRRLEEEYDELVSGKRCVRVRDLIDAGARVPGLRDQRRLDRHISHCQSCRRHALMAGVDLEARATRPSVAARIAALLPLPAVLRRSDDTPVQAFGSSHHTAVAQWSANVASTVDPATLGGWGKAIFAAATVAVAGMGAGAAIRDQHGFENFVSRGPAIVGIGTTDDQGAQGGAARRSGTAGLALTSSRHHGQKRGPGAAPKTAASSSASGTTGSAPLSAGNAATPTHSTPGSPVKPGPGGAPAGSGAAGGSQSDPGGPGGALDGQAGSQAAASAAAVTSAVQGIASQIGNTPSGVAGQWGAVSQSSPTALGQLQAIAAPVAATLGGK